MEIDNSVEPLLNENSFWIEIKKEIKDSLELNESIVYPNMRHNEVGTQRKFYSTKYLKRYQYHISKLSVHQKYL